MNDEDLRALVRAAIARQAAAHPASQDAPPQGVMVRRHPSHGLFMLPVGADAEGPCIIEPTVSCTHCGYCQSYGH